MMVWYFTFWFAFGLGAWLRAIYLDHRDVRDLGVSAGVYILATSALMGPFLFVTIQKD